MSAMPGCAKPASPAPVQPNPAATAGSFAEIAALEATRGSGVGRLAELASTANEPDDKAGSSGDARMLERMAAIRGLGRIGDTEAVATLEAALGDPEPGIRRQVIWALGIAGARAAEPRLLTLYMAAVDDTELRAAIIEALGRLGGPTSSAVLAEGLAEPQLAEHAALALGRWGRRQLSFEPEVRGALVEAGRAASVSPGNEANRSIRRAVAFALLREHEPAEDAAAISLLETLARDPDGDRETQAMAVRALGTRNAGSATRIEALGAEDWRARVEAVRSMGRKGASAQEHAALAVFLLREWNLLVANGWTGPRVHIITDGLRALAGAKDDEVVRRAIVAIHESAAAGLSSASEAAQLTASTAHCLSAALLTPPQRRFESVTKCGGPVGRGMPEHERRALAADIAANDLQGGAEYLGTLFQHSDGRVRATAARAMAAAIPASHDHPSASAHRELLRAALDDSAIEVAGAAADTLAQLAKSENPRDQEVAKALAPDLLEAARRHPPNSELALTFLSALTAARPPGGEEVCRSAHSSANRSVRGAARSCLEAYTGTDPGPGAAAGSMTLPPAGPATVLGKRVTLTVVTSKGTIVIELDPQSAPWHVASVAYLAQKGFYSDLLWHRIVPNFVAQGGDPTGSGWGGPGFVIPAEPSAIRYRRGTMGIADAGLDTGGSQWFIMHSAAPHLDGRYTAIGQVTQGQDVVDSLMVGDRIRSATVEIRQAP